MEDMRELTILTRAPRWSYIQATHGAKVFVKGMLKTMLKRTSPLKNVGGPLSLERYLLKGLEQIAQPYRLNPHTSNVTPYVGILRSIQALKWAIKMKRRGKIRRLIAGPTVVSVPVEHNRIIESPLIDCVIVPSNWVKDLFCSLSPSLRPRLRVWASGVDEEYWKPEAKKSQNVEYDFLIYHKDWREFRPPPSLLTALLSELRKNHFTYYILKYKQFTEDYRALLNKSRYMVYLSEQETQGLALFEAWACDVPTLVWDRRYWEWKVENRTYEWAGASSAPYLTEECGLSFKDEHELPDKLMQFLSKSENYTPRKFILDNYTLALAARKYVSILLDEP